MKNNDDGKVGDGDGDAQGGGASGGLALPAPVTPLQRLEALERRALEGGGAERVQRQHDAGKLTRATDRAAV